MFKGLGGRDYFLIYLKANEKVMSLYVNIELFFRKALNSFK